MREVEQGYLLTIHDFTVDLALRDLLTTVQEAVTPDLQAQIGSALEPLDTRFRAATWRSDRPIHAPLEEPAAEWWFRIPLRAGPDLELYLFGEGLLPRR